MDEAARARAAARDAIADISPAHLRDLIDERLRDAPMTPGVLTWLSARATDQPFDRSALAERSAGVQLIYEGLGLTRTIARAPPWHGGDGQTRADLDVLAADVLVSRGFSLLADTEAASTAVETVRSFGRDETNRAIGSGDVDRALEADVFELAIVAGMSATGVEPPPGSRRFAVDLAQSLEFDGEAPELCAESAVDALADLATDRDRPVAAPERIWTGSSATDP